MSPAPFAERLLAAAERTGTSACVGLDPHFPLLPRRLGTDRVAAMREFCLGAIAAVRDVVPAIKPQSAFFEALGSRGVAVLEEVVGAAREAGLLVVLDAKRGDIGSTAEAYAQATLDDTGPIGADAVTLSPYLGAESLAPFLVRCDRGKGIFVLVRTSNPGAGEWQGDVAPRVASFVAEESARRAGPSGYGPVGAVVGATLPGEAALWRERLPSSIILVPGYGAQGATAKDVRAQFRDGRGALVVSARAVLFPATGDDGDGWREAIGSRARAFAAEIREAAR